MSSATPATSTTPIPRNTASALPPPGKNVKSLGGLTPFLRPYRWRIALAVGFLVMAAVSTLVLPVALKTLIDQGLVAADPGERVMALRDHFFSLFGVGAALGLFSALRYYTVTWLGERVTADLRNAVYSHVLRQSPEFFESTQTGEVLSRLTTDTTLVQAVVGSSLSLGLRNVVMAIGAMTMLIITNPYVMAQVLGILVLVVLPSVYFARRIRKLSRASQDRVADTSAIAAEVLNAIPVVQSYTQETREAQRFDESTQNAFGTAVSRTRTSASTPLSSRSRRAASAPPASSSASACCALGGRRDGALLGARPCGVRRAGARHVARGRNEPRRWRPSRRPDG